MRTTSLWLLILAAGCAAGVPPRVDPRPATRVAPVRPGPVTSSVVGPLNRGVVEWDIAGVKVVYKRRPSSDVVALRLILKGGCRNLTPENAGIEMLSLSVGARGGTARLDREALATRLERIGSSIGASAERDYSTISLSTFRQSFGAAWELFDAVLREASFSPGEVARLRDEQLATMRRMPEEPSSAVESLSFETLYAGHPYLNRQVGFVPVVERLDAAALQAYWRDLLVRDRALVVVVGDLDEAELRSRLAETLGALPARGSRGAYVDEAPPALAVDDGGVRFEARALPTSYITGLYAAPPPASADYPALLMSSRILSNRLFEEVRTKRNLSYAAAARLRELRANYGAMQTIAQDPRATLAVMFREVERIQVEPVSERELRAQVNLFVTSMLLGLETNDAQAAKLAHWEVVAGRRQYADELLAQLREVRAGDVQRVSRRYLRHFRFGVVGPAEQFDASLYRVH